MVNKVAKLIPFVKTSPREKLGIQVATLMIMSGTVSKLAEKWMPTLSSGSGFARDWGKQIDQFADYLVA